MFVASEIETIAFFEINSVNGAGMDLYAEAVLSARRELEILVDREKTLKLPDIL